MIASMGYAMDTIKDMRNVAYRCCEKINAKIFFQALHENFIP